MFHHKIVSSAIILKISLNRHSSKLFFMVKPPVYALEGSVAVAGTGLSWLRSNLGVVNEIKEVEELAAKVEDTGDVYFVPAFSGLFAPYWR
jgi:glycerol kinase